MAPAQPFFQRASAVYFVKWLLAIWMIGYTAFAARAVLILVVQGGPAGCAQFGMACPNPPGIFTALLHAMLGGILGAGVLGMVSFHRYVSMLGVFDVRHAWGYLFAPLLGAVLGLIVFALLQSGLLIFSGNTVNQTTVVANLGYLALGFLSGFGWYSATRRIERLVTRFFSENEDLDVVGDRDASHHGEAVSTTTDFERPADY
jgi:hypothetical protein